MLGLREQMICALVICLGRYAYMYVHERKSALVSTDDHGNKSIWDRRLFEEAM